MMKPLGVMAQGTTNVNVQVQVPYYSRIIMVPSQGTNVNINITVPISYFLTESDTETAQNGIGVRVFTNHNVEIRCPMYRTLTNGNYNLTLTMAFYGEGGVTSGKWEESSDTSLHYSWASVNKPGTPEGSLTTLMASIVKNWNALEDAPGTYSNTITLTMVPVNS